MRRTIALLSVAALAACQDYQFTPVGRCLLQPGRASVTNTASVLDILFVVDDSRSMDPIQENLAANLGGFIERLAQKQTERVRAGKQPFDIYVAVTSSSVLVNRTNGAGGYDVVTNYYNYTSLDYCTPGVLKANGDPYPSGNFVAAGANAKVLAFTKDLNWANAANDATINGLIAQFKSNVKVGSCGANQEMPLAAARLALQKGMRGEQRLPAGLVFPHAASKITVIFVTNEDDCSTGRADQGGLVWQTSDILGDPDSCVRDAAGTTTPSRLTPYGDFTAFLRSLERPIAAAFVRGGITPCADASTEVSSKRLAAFAKELRDASFPTIEESVCNSSFGPALEKIADALPPPDRLTLPTAPAAGKVTQLRVQRPDGTVTHICQGPGKDEEWWFVDCLSNPPMPLEPGKTDACIQIKTSSPCSPQAGESLAAEYLGRVPESGCANENDCRTALGGGPGAWTCDLSANPAGTCVCAK